MHRSTYKKERWNKNMRIKNVTFPDRPYIKSMYLTTGKIGYGCYINLILVDNSIVRFNWRAKNKWLCKLDVQYL